jgi:hypothetical protein
VCFVVAIEKEKIKNKFHKRAAHGSTGVQTGKGPPPCNYQLDNTQFGGCVGFTCVGSYAATKKFLVSGRITFFTLILDGSFASA